MTYTVDQDGWPSSSCGGDEWFHRGAVPGESMQCHDWLTVAHEVAHRDLRAVCGGEQFGRLHRHSARIASTSRV